MAVHVRYKSMHISLSSSAKQQREMTKFYVVLGTWTAANFGSFHLELSCRCIFSFSTSLEPLAYQADLGNYFCKI